MPPLLPGSSIPTRSRNSRNGKKPDQNQSAPGAFWFMLSMSLSQIIPDCRIICLQFWFPKWQAEKLPSERGRNYTPLREVVHCALPGASCGQQMISVDFQSAPIITGEATLPLLSGILETPVSVLLGETIESKESVSDKNAIAEQLSRVNSQLSEKTLRNRRVWSIVKIALISIVVITLLIMLLSAAK